MPIERCTLPNGGKGYRYGQSGKCYKDGRDAAKQGIAITGSPEKFKEEMKSEKSGANLAFAKVALDEYYKELKSDKSNAFKSIASYLSKSDDGQNSSDVDRSSFLDNKEDKSNAEKSDYVDNAGNFSGNPAKTGDGSGNEFNEPTKKPKASSSLDWKVDTGEKPSSDFTCDETGETPYDPQKKPAEASLTWKIDEGKPAPDSTSHPATEEPYDPQKPPAVAGKNSPSDGDDYGKGPGTDNDGDEPDPIAKSELDTDTKKVGSHTVVPPYNKDASPETDPDKKVPDYPTYSKTDTRPSGGDNRTTLDPKVQYEVKNPRSGKAEMLAKPDDAETTMADKTIQNIPEGEDIVRKSVVGNVYSTNTEEVDSVQGSELWMNACAYISEKERDKVPEENFAGPKGSRSYPIRNGKDVEDAARLVGHSPSPTQTKKRIIEIAHRLGLQAHLPESWKKPEHQTASAYEEALALFGKLSADEKKTLKAKLEPEWEEQAVRGPQETGPTQ